MSNFNIESNAEILAGVIYDRISIINYNSKTPYFVTLSEDPKPLTGARAYARRREEVKRMLKQAQHIRRQSSKHHILDETWNTIKAEVGANIGSKFQIDYLKSERGKLYDAERIFTSTYRRILDEDSFKENALSLASYQVTNAPSLMAYQRTVELIEFNNEKINMARFKYCLVLLESIEGKNYFRAKNGTGLKYLVSKFSKCKFSVLDNRGEIVDHTEIVKDAMFNATYHHRARIEKKA